jgi:hypothetical protein
MMAEASDDKGHRRSVQPGMPRSGRDPLLPDFEAELRSRIGRGLQSECQHALSEPLPPRLQQLLGDLEKVSRDHADDDHEDDADDPYRQPGS